jgi:phosphate starvation-inducible PhoH-like protein
VTLTGPAAACETARDVLEKLYARIRQGEDVGPGDVDGLLRHAADEAPPADGLAQIRTRRRVVTARTPNQGLYIQAMDRVDLVFGLGPAGTGKTYLAVAYAAQCLERGQVERIVLSRPAVEAGERLGFLPGDMREKVDPYLRPLYDALYDVLPPAKVERDLATGVIEIAPLAFMRGRTLAHAFVILDEAQNTTSMQMKMFLTRLGEGSKMAVTGDPSQIDLPPGQKSGLEDAVGLLAGIRGIEAIRFTAADVVRRDLVARIVEAYDKAR